MSAELTLLRCQTCGGEVTLLTANGLQCLYCGNVYTPPGVAGIPPEQERFVWQEGPLSRDNAAVSNFRVTYPGVTLQEYAKSISARWRGSWW